MSRIVFHSDKISEPAEFLKLCPFSAIEYDGKKLEAGAGCRMCGLCVKKGPVGAAEIIKDELHGTAGIEKYSGIAVFSEQINGKIQPVTLELLGKARELAAECGQKVFAVCVGAEASRKAFLELRQRGADRAYLYLDDCFSQFRLDSYAAALKDFAVNIKPNVILVGATTAGRQLAPRLAAKLRTGLTADCTELEIGAKGDLIQIRPAFGGNIMARIHTPNHRPQMATVRPKVMLMPDGLDFSAGEAIDCPVPNECRESRIRALGSILKPPAQFIEDAEVLVAVGRGVKKKEDVAMAERLAASLGGQVAGTRPMVENGFIDSKRQIGLSGRTVRPKLIITLGVSGAIQFVAGMQNADEIIAINTDAEAPIFKAAHYALVGDLYSILPRLIDKIESRGATNEL